MFIRTAKYCHLLNMNHIVEIYFNDGYWYARLTDERRIKLGDGEYPEKQVRAATARFVPTAGDEFLFRFSLHNGEMHHEKLKILAWEVSDTNPGALTVEGITDLGWNLGSLTVIERPDGGYDDYVDRSYADQDEIKAALEGAAAREAAQ